MGRRGDDLPWGHRTTTTVKASRLKRKAMDATQHTAHSQPPQFTSGELLQLLTELSLNHRTACRANSNSRRIVINLEGRQHALVQLVHWHRNAKYLL